MYVRPTAEGSREWKDLASTRMLCLLLFAVQFRTIGKGVGIETGMVRGVRKGNRRKLVRLLIKVTCWETTVYIGIRDPPWPSAVTLKRSDIISLTTRGQRVQYKEMQWRTLHVM